MKVRLLRSLVAIVVTLGSSRVTPSQARTLTIVENGQAKMPIVVFKDASYLTRLAADDLADYIGKVSGARPQVIQGWPDPLPQHAIWVGCQPGLEKLFPGLDLQFHHPEEIVIAANDAHVLIAGRDRWVPGHLDVPAKMMEQGGSRQDIIHGVQQEYGTANAVSAFMHAQLGIRWLWPREVDIPVRSTLALAPFVYARGGHGLQRPLPPRCCRGHGDGRQGHGGTGALVSRWRCEGECRRLFARRA